MTDHTISPVQLKNRITSLDLLRGFALLGILIMNIISFSGVGSAYINPTIGAGLESYNGIIHGFSYLFADMRFMSLFSILFGAGVVLFSNNAIEKGRKVAKYHYRRMILLLIFGLIHAYILWPGDILVCYALCGCLVFLMRNISDGKLKIFGVLFFIIPILFSYSTYFFTPADTQAEIFQFFSPTLAEQQQEIATMKGSFMDQMSLRIESAMELQTFIFLIETMWRVLSMMLLGILLFRKGVLQAKLSQASYLKMATIGLGVGLFISGIGLYRSYTHDWNASWVMNIGHHYNYVASVIMALGYIGLIMIWNKKDSMSWLKLRLQAAGRMAFTNYIFMSMACTLIFYGHGLGLIGTMDRLELMGVVFVIWIVILTASPLILNKYRQGPLEYIWRKLTYL